MTIWILALLLLASLAGMGYRQGVIRVAFSLLGILVAVPLAALLAKLIAPVVKVLGVSNPVLLWALPPFIVFCIILAAFKLGGLTVHQKVDVLYRYKASDLQQALWERLSRRLGLCLGLVNGAAYLILVCFVIYSISYWTSQMAASDGDSKLVRLVNRMGKDLQSTGMLRSAAAVGRLPESFFQAADIAGLIFHNPLLEARLSRYPGLLDLGERPEFQALSTDSTLLDLRQRQRPLRELLAVPSVRQVTEKPDVLRAVWNTLEPDLADLRTFLETGRSAKYDSEEILGRWIFNVPGTVQEFRRSKPGLPGSEVAKIRAWLSQRFARTSLVATTEKKVFLKEFPDLKVPVEQQSPAPTRKLEGQWRESGDNYSLTIDGQNITAKIIGERLSFTYEDLTLVFTKKL